MLSIIISPHNYAKYYNITALTLVFLWRTWCKVPHGALRCIKKIKLNWVQILHLLQCKQGHNISCCLYHLCIIRRCQTGPMKSRCGYWSLSQPIQHVTWPSVSWNPVFYDQVGIKSSSHTDHLMMGLSWNVRTCPLQKMPVKENDKSLCPNNWRKERISHKSPKRCCIAKITQSKSFLCHNQQTWHMQ